MYDRVSAIKKLVIFKLIFVSVAVFAPFSHPHIIRQNDTLGISLRYWLRWFTEADLLFPLFPALLQAGDQYGIQNTEFPIITLLFAPFFSLPNPWSIFLAKFSFLLLNLVLTYVSYQNWKDIKLFKTDFKFVHYILLIFGVSNVFFIVLCQIILRLY